MQSLLSNDVYVTLESESEQIRASICAEEAFAGDVASRREALAAATEQLNKRRADLNRRLVAASGESDARSLEGRLALRRAALSSALAESSALARQSNLFQTQREQAQDELSCLRAEIAEHAKRLEEAAAARRVAEGRNEEALAAVPEAVGLLGEARTELALWESRVEVLEAAAKTAGGRPPAELTASLEGFLGTVNELLEPEEGWEKAYAAALGGLAEALVMEGPESSLLALEALRHWRSEAVLLPLGVNADSPPPSIGEPLTAHVRVVAERAEKLPENLLSGVLVVDDHKDALAGLKVFPQGVFVTRRGDCFTVRGWKPGVEEIARAAADAPEIDAPDALEAARARLAEAESAHAEALSEASAASAVLLKADEAYREAERLISTSRERASLLDGRLTTLQPAAESAEKRLKSSRSAGAQLRVEVDDLEGRLSESKVREEAARSQADAEEESLASEDKRNAEAARALDLASAESAARERIFRKRLEEIETRLQAHRSSVDTASNSALSDKIASLEKMSGLLSERESELRLLLERLRSQHTRLGELTRARFASLDFLRAKRNRLVAQAEDLAGAFLEAERVETELSVRREALVETLHSRHGCDPVSGMAATSLPEGVSVSTRVKELEKLLGRIGLINPLAEREYELLSARYEFLTSQVDDVRRSKRDLNKVIRAIDSDIVQVFSKFYEQVSASFESCFLTLFEGGAGRLRLTDPANPLESGVEIEARPGGKYLRKLTLLSGGERSLTALALVFALLRSQNSPFFVLDEVDAALDDVNLQRFLRLTREFRSEVQLLMVSHQKRTMEIADCLLGVSMKSGSGSRVISERPSAKAVVSEPPLLAHAER